MAKDENFQTRKLSNEDRSARLLRSFDAGRGIRVTQGQADALRSTKKR